MSRGTIGSRPPSVRSPLRGGGAPSLPSGAAVGGQHAAAGTTAMASPQGDPNVISVSRPPSCYSTNVPREWDFKGGRDPNPRRFRDGSQTLESAFGDGHHTSGAKNRPGGISPHVGIASRGVYGCSSGAARTSATHLCAVARLSLSAWCERRASALLVGALYFQSWSGALFA